MDSKMMCRLCAKQHNSEEVIYLFGKDLNSLEWRKKIKKYTPIKLKENPDKKLPQHMCLHCCEKLQSCDLFWQQCELADKMILAKLDSQQEAVLEEIEKSKSKPKRGSYCVAKWCNNSNVSGCSLFRIPKGNRGKEWLKRADRPDLLHLDYTKLQNKYLCDKHFTKECFLRSNYLTWNALPTKFDDYKKYLPKSTSQNTQQPEVAKELPGLQKLRPILPAPAKRPTILPEEVSASCVPTTSKSQNLSRELPVNINSVQSTSLHIPRSENVLISKSVQQTKQNITYNQTNDREVFLILPSDSVKLVNNSVLKDDKRTVLLVGGNKKHSTEQDKHISEPSDKKVKVESLSDGIEMFNDIESLVPAHAYTESLHPCSGCGDIFLMKSSLMQHKKRYHSEHFDDNCSV